jgi:hypothetical protein
VVSSGSEQKGWGTYRSVRATSHGCDMVLQETRYNYISNKRVDLPGKRPRGLVMVVDGPGNDSKSPAYLMAPVDNVSGWKVSKCY